MIPVGWQADDYKVLFDPIIQHTLLKPLVMLAPQFVSFE